MNGTIKVNGEDFASMTPEQQAYIRTLGKAWREAADLRQVVAEQDRKIAEQEALLDRYDAAMKAQAFLLGTQDRELMQLRSRVNAAEAGDVATLRINNAFQHSEIMRLKVALVNRELALALCRECSDNMRRTYDRQSAMIEALEAERAELQAKVADTEAERDELLQGITVNATDIERLHKAANEAIQRANNAEADLAYLRSRSAETTLAIAQGSIKALQNDVERLKGIADHSNNLAQNRLEELAKLRRELAVARDAAAKLDDMVIRSRTEAEELTTALAQSEAIRSEQRQAIGQLTTALIGSREAAAKLEAKLADYE